ncbi:MAG: hypothetical protein ACT4PE_18105 [Candidatus Eiseniibacteriota bacterium]
MRARHLPLVALLLAAPAEFTPGREDTTASVGLTPQRTDTTTVRLHAGGGSFALIARSCSGEPPDITEADYGEVAGEVRHQRGRWVVGLRAGVVGHDYAAGRVPIGGLDPYVGAEESTSWINPYVGAEWDWLGLSAGWFGNEGDFPIGDGFFDDIPMSAHVRLGARRHPHATFDFASADPLYSSGGVLAVGGGKETRAGHYFWAGLAAEPFDEGGLALRADIRAKERLDVLLRMRAGESEGIDEFGFSAGLGWRVSP